MKLSILCLSVVIVTGCDTILPNNSDSTLTPEQRRAASHARQAEHEQRHYAEELRNTFKRYSTGELHIMRARYMDLTGKTTTLDAGERPLAVKIWGNADRANTEKLITIERELLRRWNLGDAAAFLPDFKQPQ